MDSGLEEALWDFKWGVLVEWTELFPEVRATLIAAQRPVISVDLMFDDSDPQKRRVIYRANA